MTYKIANNWFEGVERVPTKKKRGKLTPKFIIIHYTAGWSFASDLYTLTASSREASCHLLIGADGRLVQMGGFTTRMWHAGPSKSDGYTDINSYGIGIELTNIGWLKKVADGVWVDPYGQRLNARGKFEDSDRDLGLKPQITEWETGRHFNNGSGEFAWQPFPLAQLEQLDKVVASLLQKYPSIEYIRGHDEIDTRGWKTDPGLAFPMRRYTRMIEDRGMGALPVIGDVAKNIHPEVNSVFGKIDVTEPRSPGFLVFTAKVTTPARAEPDSEGFALALVPSNAGVNVTDQHGDWYFGKFFDENKEWKLGWIEACDLQPTAE
jgi:N-acetyl-anhydromuramyl-L-alanine amidase AmpD